MPMLTPMLSRLAIAIAVAVVLAGTAVAANPHDPQKRFTSADQAYARTLLLKRSDLPGAGWQGTKSGGDSSTCNSFDPDESKLVETGEQESLEFTRKGAFVASMAAIFRTKKDAGTSWNFEAKPQVLNCLAEGLAQTSTGGATFTVREIVALGRTSRLGPQRSSSVSRSTSRESGSTPTCTSSASAAGARTSR